MTDPADLPVADLPLADLSVETGERPHLGPLAGATDAHRTQGRRLAAIHRMHLMDIARVQTVLDEIEAGRADPARLPGLVLGLDMAANYRTFGSLCGRECQVLRFHHDAEEAALFPPLAGTGMAGLSAVIERLRAEHVVVHELIERLHRAAMALMFEQSEENFAAARDTFAALAAAVRSHFGYEETELEEAIGLYLPDTM